MCCAHVKYSWSRICIVDVCCVDTFHLFDITLGSGFVSIYVSASIGTPTRV